MVAKIMFALVATREITKLLRKKKKMRKKKTPKFKVEVTYKETPDAKDRLRQLWDLLLSLPDPEKPSENSKGQKAAI